MRSCVIVVENLPVPFDRRVWQEAQALHADGWRVSVICPRTSRHPLAYEEINGIAVYRHSLPFEARGRLGFVFEYMAALFHEFRLLIRVHRERGFDVIQICNPPDLLFLAAAPWKLLGKKVVFDHHDICPELFAAKFGKTIVLRRLMLMLEWATFKVADIVVSTNESFREIAMRRGRKKPSDVVTVYSIPAKAMMRRTQPRPDVRAKASCILGYLGIIGDQDGVDHLVRMLSHLVHEHRCPDVHAVVVGDGPALASVRELASSLEMDRHLTFTGYLSGDELLTYLSSFDIGIVPDPPTEYNDKISMNKIFEYSALGIPSVAYPLAETKRLLGEAAIYSKDDTIPGLADACIQLIRDPDERARRGRHAGELAERKFNWATEASKYAAAYRRFASNVPEPVVETTEIIGPMP
jgi:glycosyltransferase involved in cell wall biosynthesis